MQHPGAWIFHALIGLSNTIPLKGQICWMGLGEDMNQNGSKMDPKWILKMVITCKNYPGSLNVKIVTFMVIESNITIIGEIIRNRL